MAFGQSFEIQSFGLGFFGSESDNPITEFRLSAFIYLIIAYIVGLQLSFRLTFSIKRHFVRGSAFVTLEGFRRLFSYLKRVTQNNAPCNT